MTDPMGFEEFCKWIDEMGGRVMKWLSIFFSAAQLVIAVLLFIAYRETGDIGSLIIACMLILSARMDSLGRSLDDNTNPIYVISKKTDQP